MEKIVNIRTEIDEKQYIKRNKAGMPLDKLVKGREDAK